MFCSFFSLIDKIFSNLPECLVNLAMRLVIFKVFWFSVQSKITGWTVFDQHFAFWNITDNTFLLFDFEYAIPLIPSIFAAYLATFTEFFFSVMVLIGLFTRFSALGLVLLTLVIQFFVDPSGWWTTHVYWLLILLYLLRYGGGKFSVDRCFI